MTSPCSLPVTVDMNHAALVSPLSYQPAASASLSSPSSFCLHNKQEQRQTSTHFLVFTGTLLTFAGAFTHGLLLRGVAPSRISPW